MPRTNRGDDDNGIETIEVDEKKRKERKKKKKESKTKGEGVEGEGTATDEMRKKKAIPQEDDDKEGVDTKPAEMGSLESQVRYEADEFGESHVTAGTVEGLIYALASDRGQIGITIPSFFFLLPFFSSISSN